MAAPGTSDQESEKQNQNKHYLFHLCSATI